MDKIWKLTVCSCLMSSSNLTFPGTADVILSCGMISLFFLSMGRLLTYTVQQPIDIPIGKEIDHILDQV